MPFPCFLFIETKTNVSDNIIFKNIFRWTHLFRYNLWTYRELNSDFEVIIFQNLKIFLIWNLLFWNLIFLFWNLIVNKTWTWTRSEQIYPKNVNKSVNVNESWTYLSFTLYSLKVHKVILSKWMIFNQQGNLILIIFLNIFLLRM